MFAMCSRDATASLHAEQRRALDPPELAALTSGMPGWLADVEYVTRVARERSDNLRDMDFWLTLPTLALHLDALVDAPRLTPSLAREAARFANRLADELPRPLRRQAVFDAPMLATLPPFLPLSQCNPFVVALQAHGLAVLSAFLGHPDASALAVAVDRVRSLLATYCLAAGLQHHLATAPDLQLVTRTVGQ